MRLNPFRPNAPIGPGMFAGRGRELLALQAILNNSKVGNPGHFMITGERGIGKTSLMLFFKSMCNGSSQVNEEEKHNYLILDLDLDRRSTRRGFMERIRTKLDRELGKEHKTVEFLKNAWGFLSRVKVLDCGIDPAQKEAAHEEIFFDDLAQAFNDVCAKLCARDKDAFFGKEYDGIILLIDEADNCPDAFGIGEFFKLFLEKLQRLGCSKVCVGLVGLPHLREKLSQSHPSSVRIFNELKIDRLDTGDINAIITRCISETGKVGPVASIEGDAVRSLISLSEGFPHFLHQFGYSAFDFDMDGVVSDVDVTVSAFRPGGALAIIGEKYYRDDFFNKIQGDEYRQVLIIMAQQNDGWVTKDDIRKHFKGKPTTLNNAIKALRDRKIILDKTGFKGIYKLQNKGFAVWITMQAQQIEEKQKETP